MMTVADQTVTIARHVRIRGRVQGVFFRAWTTHQAEDLGLAGWVRNRIDGTVEALFAGPQTAVEDMLRRCHEGPPAAEVKSVDVAPAEVPQTDAFTQKPTS